MKNHLAKAIADVTKRANANATLCTLVWAALALREEDVGGEQLRRILENIKKYARLTVGGEIDIDDQLKHIENVTGLRICWKKDYEITIEEIEEAEQYETEE